MKEIDKIVTEIYNMFLENKPLEDIDACTICCMSEQNAKKIKSLKVQDIPLELLKEYQDAAKPEKLNLNELKYFAPRYFELIKDFQFPSFAPLLSLNRFGYFDAADWTAKERELLDRFALEFFKVFLITEQKEIFVSPLEILIMFHKANLKIDNLLKVWEKSTKSISLIIFNNFLEELTITNKGIFKVRNPFADKKFKGQICDWVNSEKVKNIFKQKIELEIMNDKSIFSEIELEKLSYTYEIIN